MTNRGWTEDLNDIARADVDELIKKDAEYGSSWKLRGGVGSYMMLARKIDRIENQVKKHGYDIFAALKADPRPEGLSDDLGDLARYILLVRAEQKSWGVDLTNPTAFAIGTRVKSLTNGDVGTVEPSGVLWDSGRRTWPHPFTLELLPEKVGCRTCELSERRVPRQQPYGYNGEE